MTIDEEIAKLDLIASDAFEGGDANEFKQLAEWLRELKDYKDARVGCEYCKHNYREQHERPCSLCQRNFMDMFEEGDGNDSN